MQATSAKNCAATPAHLRADSESTCESASIVMWRLPMLAAIAPSMAIHSTSHSSNCSL